MARGKLMDVMRLLSPDPINRPAHYTFGAVEPIDAIEAWGCDFLEGNIIKYVARWRRKGGVQDLKKAAWYLNRLIDREANLENKNAPPAPTLPVDEIQNPG